MLRFYSRLQTYGKSSKNKAHAAKKQLKFSTSGKLARRLHFCFHLPDELRLVSFLDRPIRQCQAVAYQFQLFFPGSVKTGQ